MQFRKIVTEAISKRAYIPLPGLHLRLKADWRSRSATGYAKGCSGDLDEPSTVSGGPQTALTWPFTAKTMF